MKTKPLIIALLCVVVMFGATQPAYAQSNSQLVLDIKNIVLSLQTSALQSLSEISATVSSLFDTVSSLTGEVAAIRTDTTAIRNNIETEFTQIDEKQNSAIREISALKGEVQQLRGILLADTDNTEMVSVLNELNEDITERLIALDEKISSVNIPATTTTTPPIHTITPTVPTQTTPTQTTTTIQPTPVGNVFVVDTDTIRIENVFYNLAFVNAPELGEVGSRAIIEQLENICVGTNIVIEIRQEGKPTGTEIEALINCNGNSANEAVVNLPAASFDDTQCTIREFVGIEWVDTNCESTASPTPGRTPGQTSPTTPTTPTTPTLPVIGTLERQVYTFSVTVGDAERMIRNSDGDPSESGTISCLFTHTPERISIAVDDTPTPYSIIANPDYTNNRANSYVKLTSPIDRDILNQKLQYNDNNYIFLNNPTDILILGEGTHTYELELQFADWDDAVFNDTMNDPPVLTEEEKAKKIIDIRFDILTNVANNECSFDLIDTSSINQEIQTETRPLRGVSTTGSGFDLIPTDVSCSEEVTIVGVTSSTPAPLFPSFANLDFVDKNDEEDTVTIDLSNNAEQTISFKSNNFVFGEENTVFARNSDDANENGLSLLTIKYLASGNDVCTFTERT